MCNCKLSGKAHYRVTCPKCGLSRKRSKHIEDPIFEEIRKEYYRQVRITASGYITWLREFVPPNAPQPIIPIEWHQWNDRQKDVWGVRSHGWRLHKEDEILKSIKSNIMENEDFLHLPKKIKKVIIREELRVRNLMLDAGWSESSTLRFDWRAGYV